MIFGLRWLLQKTAVEVLPYLLKQVTDHQEALPSQHLLLHHHRALQQLHQEGQESGTVKHKDPRQPEKLLSPHRWINSSCVKKPLNGERQRRKKNSQGHFQKRSSIKLRILAPFHVSTKNWAALPLLRINMIRGGRERSRPRRKYIFFSLMRSLSVEAKVGWVTMLLDDTS